jgi:predicted ATP-grasp superfamily ATP-dependent carboligase
MSVLAVAAVSARLLAEAAARDGHSVVALDLFGDADTRRVSERWVPIGAAGGLEIDAARVLEALDDLAQRRGDHAVIGWIPGSGFEGLPDLLDAGATRLPLIGTPPEGVRRVRDPQDFFGMLATHGIAHPSTRFDPPAEAAGWLRKDARGCGGWHIRRASSDDRVEPGGAVYFQREMPGVPMSATFIADGARAMLLGCNELIVRPMGARPHVYAGCIGPVDVPAEIARQVAAAVRLLVAEFGLRGWCSLDFIRRDDGEIGVLEVNPRPPASLALYAGAGLIDAQLRACFRGKLPAAGALALPPCMAGHEIVYARWPLTLTPRGAQHLADRADVHDLPAAGAQWSAGDPICSLSTTGADAVQVRGRLAAARDDLLMFLETA